MSPSPTLSEAERTELLGEAVAVARIAGQMAAEAWAQPRGGVTLKGAIDLVTETDRACEERIVAELTRRTSLPVLGEEGGQHGASSAPAQWIVDPIDGTTNFAHRLPHFAVSIGLAVGGEPALGVVYAPVAGEVFATDGERAWCNDRPLATLEPLALGSALLVTGFPYDRHTHPDTNLDLFAAFTMRARCTRVNGSAALDLAYVAATRADAYWERSLKPWDACAGVALVRAVGGEVTDYAGARYALVHDTLVAGHPALTDAVRAVIREVRP